MRIRHKAILGVALLAASLAACARSIPFEFDTPEVATPAQQAPAFLAPPSPIPTIPSFAPWYVEGVTVATYAGTGEPGYRDGPAAQAQFNVPAGLAIDTDGNLYVFDWWNFRVRMISPEGMVSTLAGSGEPGYADGPAAVAKFRGLAVQLAIDTNGNLIVPDSGNHRIRLVTKDGWVTTLAGTGEPGYRDGPADQAQFNNPTAVAIDTAGNIYVGDTDNNRIRVITPEGQVRTLAGSGEPGYSDGPGAVAQFDAPSSVAVSPAGDVVVGEGLPWLFRATRRLRIITPDGEVATLAGSGEPGHKDGPAAEARFVMPTAMAFDAHGYLLVADPGEARLRLVTPEGQVYTLAGTGELGRADGPGPAAQFAEPVALVLGRKGEAYLSEPSANTIRRIDYGTPAFAVVLPTSTPSPQERVIRIGYALLRKGPDYDWLLKAAAMAVDEANAAGAVTVGGERHTFQLVVSPWCCGEEGAVFGADWLIQQDVVAVVGYVRSEGALAASPVYDAAGVVHITPIAQDPAFTLAGHPTAYRVAPNLAYGAPISARMVFEDLGVRRAALMVEPLQAGISVFQYTSAVEWGKAFEALGGEVLRYELTPQSLAEIAIRIQDQGAEALVIFRPQAWVNSDLLVQQIREAGLEMPIVSVFGNFGPTSPDPQAEGLYDLIPGRPVAAMRGYADFAAKYRGSDFGLVQEPLPHAAFGYDAMNLVIAAIRIAAQTGEVTRESVAAAMQTFRDQAFQGVTGSIQFDEYGDLVDQPYYFRKAVEGKWVDIPEGEQ